MKNKEKFFVPNTCLECINDCKMQINIKLKESFENNKSGVICKKYIKIKKNKEDKENKKWED